jgi:type IV pilus assembly protein PilA
MRIPKRGEKGFTLIELLIVVAILGVLAAVVIPNVGRFIGRGESEAEDTEFANIQSAVVAMMVDNGLSSLPNPVTTRTNDMFLFPDATSDDTDGSDADSLEDKLNDPNGNPYDFTAAGDDVTGYRLYMHDITGDSDNASLVNYTATRTTSFWYTVDSSGAITQYSSAS